MIEDETLNTHLHHIQEYVNEMSPSPREDVRSRDSSQSGIANIVDHVVVQPQAKELLLNNTITLPY